MPRSASRFERQYALDREDDSERWFLISVPYFTTVRRLCIDMHALSGSCSLQNVAERRERNLARSAHDGSASSATAVLIARSTRLIIEYNQGRSK